MQFPESWLREFCNPPLTTQELANTLTMAGMLRFWWQKAGEPRRRRCLALFAAGVLLFNFPLLKLWLSDATVFGLPLLPVALFGAWALLIAVLERYTQLLYPVVLSPVEARTSDPIDRVFALLRQYRDWLAPVGFVIPRSFRFSECFSRDTPRR